MTNLKKNLPARPPIDAGFAERSGVLQTLRNQFPEVMERMIKLLVAANIECNYRLHEFAFEFDGIAYLYGRRLNSPLVNYIHPSLETHPNYVADQQARREKLEAAVRLLSGLIADLSQLDVDHLERFISFYETPTGRTTYSGPSDLFFEIKFATRVIASCQQAPMAQVPLAEYGQPKDIFSSAALRRCDTIRGAAA